MLTGLSENHCGQFETSEITVFIFSPGTNQFAVRVDRKVKPIRQKQRMSIIKWEMAAPEFPLLWYMFLNLISENWNIKQEFSAPELSPFQHIFLHYLAEIFWIPGVHIFILLISIVKSLYKSPSPSQGQSWPWVHCPWEIKSDLAFPQRDLTDGQWQLGPHSWIAAWHLCN